MFLFLLIWKVPLDKAQNTFLTSRKAGKKIFHDIVYRFVVEKGKGARYITRQLQIMYGDQAPSLSTAKKWCRVIRQEMLDGLPSSFKDSSSKSPFQIENQNVISNGRASFQQTTSNDRELEIDDDQAVSRKNPLETLSNMNANSDRNSVINSSPELGFVPDMILGHLLVDDKRFFLMKWKDCLLPNLSKLVLIILLVKQLFFDS